MHFSRTRAGFTLIELIVVISILAILAGALIPRVAGRMARSRDARRIADIQTIKSAVDQFRRDKGFYPAADQNASYGGWDVSQDGRFIPALAQEGYLQSVPADPRNDETYQYRYYVYDKDSGGCTGNGPFYVLGIKAFETADAALRHKGFFKCASRNWGDEFAYVTGGGAPDTSTANAGR